MRFFLLIFFLFYSSSVVAHEKHDPDYPQTSVIPAAIERNMVKIRKDGQYRYITSNGIPDHKTGNFPNSGNPNSISIQNHSYRIALNPQFKRQQDKEMVIGVALNGIPIEPATAECYGQKKGARPMPGQQCAWREEAIINGKGQLGLDRNNAHVQPNGTYHYHGIPYGLLSYLKSQGGLFHIGYAADGFPIYVDRSNSYMSGYALKKGQRPSGPGGQYSGKYTQDFEFIGGANRLDECNGIWLNGRYVYFLTEEFPFAPRCLMGDIDASFERHGRVGGGSNSGKKLNSHPPFHGQGHGRLPPHPRM